jgi:hypothetical protein
MDSDIRGAFFDLSLKALGPKGHMPVATHQSTEFLPQRIT